MGLTVVTSAASHRRVAFSRDWLKTHSPAEEVLIIGATLGAANEVARSLDYTAPVDSREGQTAERQLDGLASLGEALSEALDKPVEALWKMQNGYALCSRAGLEAIADYLGALQPEQVDILRGKLCIGVHSDVEVTDAAWGYRPLVSQAFCSALPVAYTRVPPSHWEAFASLVLQAAYEATMATAVLNAQRGASNVVLLTELGGGAFAIALTGFTPPCGEPSR